MRGFDLFRGDALDAYRDWPAPATIISDGAYGVRGFHGDTIGSEDLPHWYRPHIAAWAAAAARRGAAEGHAAPRRAAGAQPDGGQFGTPEPEAARVHGAPGHGRDRTR